MVKKNARIKPLDVTNVIAKRGKGLKEMEDPAFKEIANGLRKDIINILENPSNTQMMCCLQGCCISFCCVRVQFD